MQPVRAHFEMGEEKCQITRVTIQSVKPQPFSSRTTGLKVASFFGGASRIKLVPLERRQFKIPSILGHIDRPSMP